MVEQTTEEVMAILIDNLNALIKDKNNFTPSMRNLSTAIGANENYIQKIMGNNAQPSLDGLVKMSNHFGIYTWQMLYDNSENNDLILSINQNLNSLPRELLIAIKAYIEFVKNSNNLE